MRRAFLALAAGLCLSLSPPAMAQDVPGEADFLLWCGSAFHFLGIIAETDTEAEGFLAAGEILTDQGAGLLIDAGMDEQAIIGLVELYDERVIADFESDEPLPYDAQACIGALDS